MSQSQLPATSESGVLHEMSVVGSDRLRNVARHWGNGCWSLTLSIAMVLPMACVGRTSMLALEVVAASDASNADNSGDQTATADTDLAPSSDATVETPATVSWPSTTAQIAVESDGRVSLAIQLSEPVTSAVHITLTYAGTAAAGLDFSAPLPTDVEIAAGATSTMFDVTLADDAEVEPIETLEITFSGVASGPARLGGTPTRRLLVLDNDPESQSQIVSGAQHNCAKLLGGTVKCWGYNGHGELGLGDLINRGDDAGEMGAALPAVALGTDSPVYKLASGNGGSHVCALFENRRVKCWGFGATWDEPGYMGYGHSNDLGDNAAEMGDALPYLALGTDVEVRDLATSSFNSCVITTDHRAKCWGVGFHGANGNGSTTRIGASASTMGDALAYLDLGTGLRVLKIAMGAFHRCAILDNLRVKCWGLNDAGQLGYEDTETRGDAANEMGDVLPFVDLGTGAEVVDVALSTGTYYESGGVHHTCALLATGQVKCFGAGGSGQLGYESTSSRGGSVGSMGDALPVVNLGTGRTARRIYAAGRATCALLDNHDLKCWGGSDAGSLGNGSTASVGTAPGSMGDALTPVFLGSGRYAREVSGSFQVWQSTHRCALLDNHDIKCWGNNSAGELGTGNLNIIGDNAGEMTALAPIELQ